MDMDDLVDIDMKSLRIYIECFFEKEFLQLIHMNPRMILYLTISHVDLHHGYVCSLMTMNKFHFTNE